MGQFDERFLSIFLVKSCCFVPVRSRCWFISDRVNSSIKSVEALPKSIWLLFSVRMDEKFLLKSSAISRECDAVRRVVKSAGSFDSIETWLRSPQLLFLILKIDQNRFGLFCKSLSMFSRKRVRLSATSRLTSRRKTLNFSGEDACSLPNSHGFLPVDRM